MDGSTPNPSPHSHSADEHYGSMAALSSSPASATGFHALYSSPGPRRAMTDEIDMHDLEPDSDADEEEEEEEDAQSPLMSPHTPHSHVTDAAGSTAAAAGVADSVPAAQSPVATSLDDALSAPPPTEPLPTSPATHADDAASSVSSSPDEGSSTETGSVASLAAHLLSASASSSPVTSPTATRASLDDLLHSMASPPASATTDLAQAERPQPDQPPTPLSHWVNPADDDSHAQAAAANPMHSPASAEHAVATAVPSSPSHTSAAAAPVDAAADNFSIFSPQPLDAAAASVFEADSSGFNAAFDHVAAALDALQQALQQEVAAEAAFSAAEQREFDARTAALQRRSQQIETALQSLAAERTQSAERLAELRASLAEQRRHISDLESSQHELESARAVLRAARSRRLALDYARAQPLHVVLRHTEGSVRGAHRAFLRQYRREQKAAARANCNDNIHDSASDDESEGDPAEGQESDDEERGDEVTAPAASASPPSGTAAAAAAAAPSARTTRHKSVLNTSSRGVDGLMARRDSKAAADRARRNSLPHAFETAGAACSSSAGAATASGAAVPASPADGGGELDETSEDLPADWVPALDAQNRPLYPRRYGAHSRPRRGSLGSPRLVLPRPVLEHLWTFLGVRDLQSCAGACREWKGLLERPAPQGTRVWKLLHQRVSGVELRLRIEREREKATRRTTHSASSNPHPHPHPNPNPHSLPRQSVAATSLAGSESGSSSPMVQTPSASPSPASRSRQGSALLSSTPSSAAAAAAAAFVSVPVPSTPSNGGSSSAGGAHTPSTPAGLLGGMLRRFRGGSTSNLNGHAGHSGSAAAAAAAGATAAGSAAHRGSWLLHPSDASAAFPPTHLHYTLRIEIPSRDCYLLTIDGAVARSLPADPRLCLDELEADSSKGQNSVSMHMCSLRPPPHPLVDEADFCGQMFALQANLTQARLERAKIIAQIDGDEGLKKQITSEIQAVSARTMRTRLAWAAMGMHDAWSPTIFC